MCEHLRFVRALRLPGRRARRHVGVPLSVGRDVLTGDVRIEYLLPDECPRDGQDFARELAGAVSDRVPRSGGAVRVDVYCGDPKRAPLDPYRFVATATAHGPQLNVQTLDETVDAIVTGLSEPAWPVAS